MAKKEKAVVPFKDKMYPLLDTYEKVSKQMKDLEKQKDTLSILIKAELEEKKNQNILINDITVHLGVSERNTLKTDLVKEILTREKREDIIEACTVKSSVATLTVKRVNVA